MEEKYNAICIRSVSYRDNDKMLTLFTLERGLVDCILRGVKKPNAKLKFAAELFCFAEYVVVEKNDKRTVIEANEIDGFYGIRLDIDKYYCASAIIEFLRGFLRTELVSYDLFLNVTTALKSIENGSVYPTVSLVKFYLEALKRVGYGIEYSICAKCGDVIKERVFFDFEDCVFCCEKCHGLTTVEMRIKTYEFLQKLSLIDFNELKNGSLLAYSLTFDASTVLFALKFYDFFMRDKADVVIKSNKTLLMSIE